MSPSSLAELQGLKYAELRTLCKENNLKASGKTEALVAQLAEHFGLSDQTDAPDELAPAAPVKAAPKKRAASAKSKSSKTAATAEPEDEKSAEEPTAATPVKSQEKIVYMTSPGTKATVAALLNTVKDLQSQLSSARTSLSDLETAATAPRSPTLKKSEVVSLIDRKIAQHRQAMSDELEKRFKGVKDQLETVENDVVANKVEQAAEVETLRAELTSELAFATSARSALEQSIGSLRSDLTSRLSAFEQKPIEEKPANKPATSISATPEAAASPRSRKVSFADPMEDDAPPTRSVSFSSPSSPAITPVSSSTPRRSSLATGSRKATPFKLNPLDTGSSSTPASALPSHMLATAASAAKRSPRSPRTSAPAALQVEPQSPAGPPPKPTIGKRSRHSDASELSVELAALDSPVAEIARNRTATANNASGNNVVSPGRRLSEILASVSASAKKDDDHHARKRMRVSSGSIADHGPEAEEKLDSEDDEEDEDFQDSFEGSEEQETEDSFEEEEEDDEDEVEEENSVREYLVALKTGDEEPTALKPAPRASTGSTVSVHDPSFFAAPVSPASNNRRSTLDGPATTKENTAPPAVPSSARKSLPMASLPCPIVSPYAASKSSKAPASPAPSSSSASTKKPTAPTFSFGTPSTIANRRITIGPAASARKATPAAAGTSVRQAPYSATPAKKRTMLAPGSARKATPGRSASYGASAATPPAARTLFGSERFTAPPSSARSAATSQARTAYDGEEGDEEEGESRFGDDGFVSAGTSPQKVGGWGVLAGGAFGRS